MYVIEAYRTLRDRGPYPAHEVLKDLDGSFGFVVYDTKAGTVFVALVSFVHSLMIYGTMFLHNTFQNLASENFFKKKYLEMKKML